MASNNQIKGITIKIEGDTSGLAKDLQSVNSDIKKTSAALKDVEKALELDPTNVELLAAKQELLTRQIEQTTQKLALEQQAAEDAKNALEIGSISAEEYATLQAEVVNTQNSLADLESAAEGSASTLEDTGSAAADAGAEAEASGEAFEDWGEVVKASAEIAAGALAAVGATFAAIGAGVVEGGKLLVEAAGDVSAFGEEIDKASQRVGMSTDAYQRWNYALSMNGSSMSEIEGGLKALNNTFDDAKNGVQSAVDKFEALGLSMEDIADLSREDLFGVVINRLQGIDDEARRAALANDLLARSGMSLIPTLNTTAEELDALLQEAEDYGTIMSGEMVDASADYDDALYRMDASLQGLKNRLVGEFMPGMTQVMNGIAGMAAGIDGSDQEIQDGIDSIVSTFDSMVPSILQTVDALLPSLLDLGLSIISTISTGIISNLDSILMTAFSILQTLADAILQPDNLELILNSAVSILLSLVDGLIGALDMLIDPAISAVLTLVDGLLSGESIGKLTDAAIHIILSLLNSLSGALPSLIPAAIDAVVLICSTLLDNIDLLVSAAGDLIFGIIAGFWEKMPDLASTIITDILPRIIAAFARLGPQLVVKAGEWGADLIQALVNGISRAIPKLINGVKRVADTIASYLHFSVPDVGPLSDFDESGPDMIDTFIRGMESKNRALAAAAAQTGQIIYNGIAGGAPDYTGAINGISDQLAGIGGASGGNYTINVMVGTTQLASVVLSAQQMEALRSGGV